MKRSLSVLFSLVLLFTARGQCDTVYQVVDQGAHFKAGQAALARWTNKEVLPLINACYANDSIMITRLIMVLTISAKGQVMKAQFTDAEISASCRERLVKRLLAMEGWAPAMRKGMAVCGNYIWPIGCILWEEEL
jgi:hypothetical protein